MNSRKLKRLLEENAELKHKRILNGNKTETSTFFTTYNGWDVIQFMGNFKPFAMGVSKAKILTENEEIVRDFVKRRKSD